MVRLSRVSVIHLTLVVFALLLIGQAARIQLVQGKEWADRARRQQFRIRPVAAPRGRILDASGNVLAESRELVRINIAPREVTSVAGLAAAMKKAGFAADAIRAATDTSKKWITLPGLHLGSEITAVTSLPGVHPETVLNREYTTVAGIRQVIGGIEVSLDSVLAGDSARASVARDVRGRRMDSPETWATAPRPGHNVTLTINRDLQEIAERALVHATDSLEATGGDIVVLNPKTGEILAMASVRVGRRSLSNTAVTEPFEPGSTLKPFVAAALLDRNRARADEIMNTFDGEMKIGTRTITDLHKAPEMSLADVIRYSSNIGIVQFGARLTPRETFETLRDLGFGTPTGVAIPGEANGTLRKPAQWQSPSAASLAMGYEISVTPLQLVAAYSALANDGQLIQPHIVREIRDSDGQLLYRARPRPLRRVFSERVAKEVRDILVSVVDSGTAVRADLATFQLAGKSGTARRTSQGKYVEGSYTASFVGLFPAERPQYVVLVKLDSPKRAFFGGEVAAPVSAIVLRAALAAGNAALDREGLASQEKTVSLIGEGDSSGTQTLIGDQPSSDAAGEAPVMGIDPGPYAERTPTPPKLMSLPFRKAATVASTETRPVPDVSGMTTRNAVRALHRAGFRVTLVKSQNGPTIPAKGTMLPPGSVVKLVHID